jgi:hypothetical protein
MSIYHNLLLLKLITIIFATLSQKTKNNEFYENQTEPNYCKQIIKTTKNKIKLQNIYERRK